jgi:glycosyltransferase involved in cell wall biosynthesis
VLVVAAGDMNPAKQLDVVAASVARLGANVHLALVGRRIPGWNSSGLVRSSGLGGRLTVSTDVTDEEFLGWLHAADIVADLRFPHRGEVSGTLIRAMQVGRPCIVSGTGTYQDVPTDVVVHVSPGVPDADEVAAAVAQLAEDPDRRARMGAAARAHLDATSGGDRTARGYERAIEETLELVLDPRRLALTRWARALNEIGIVPEGLDEGFGLSYVRGLTELAPTEGRHGHKARATPDGPS